MARKLDFQEDKLVIHFTGMTSVAALKSILEVPYTAIKNVSVGSFDIPLLNFRVGTSGFGVREGRFLVDGEWCFVSYEKNSNLVIMELDDQEFSKVIFETDGPENVKDEILAKVKQ
ncbi:hypothetical protein [Bacillus sp. MUM 13]|uniref:hypothetical protein n=1 Tax=Bacillus sp. MUM 13 TaxID=1678001 RepID=UPI0008F5EB67|nr:hypothetical protein [Bacillus sp. MUM 13]OIK08181.1 hypothetical protein BIV59_20540 [Bacillus sp. MUM 13]